MSKVKNFISVMAMSAIAAVSLTTGALALTQSFDSETSDGDLTQVDTGYWYGIFEQKSQGLYGDKFSNCEATTLTIEKQYTATLEGKEDAGFMKIFKCVSILAVGDTTKSDYAQGNNVSYSVSVSEPNNLRHMDYRAENYIGTEMSSGMKDGYLIVVNII